MTQEEQLTVTRNETKLVGLSVTVTLNQDLEDGIIEQLRAELINKRHEIASSSRGSRAIFDSGLSR